ncbi:MAG: pilus assembly protein TadG-related protein [Chloroflexota bacterium]
MTSFDRINRGSTLTTGDITMAPQRPARHDRERGQVLVIVAGGILTLLLLAGLVIDGGIALFNRRDAQNSADLMALAGTKFVANVHQGAPNIQASTYAALAASAAANDCRSTNSVPCTWQAWFVAGSSGGPSDIGSVTPGAGVPANALGVRVLVERQPGTFLVGLAGINEWDVDTQATAVAEAPKKAPAGQLLPIAFKAQTGGYTPGQVYDITDGKDAPGGFGYISWTGSNDPNALATSICTPDNPEFSTPHSFNGDPGKSNSASVRACLDQWVHNGETILIPIYDTLTGTGNNVVYHITGVAAFVVTSRGQPAVDNIRGYFVEIYPYTNPVPAGLGSQPPTADDTSFFLGLVK